MLRQQTQELFGVLVARRCCHENHSHTSRPLRASLLSGNGIRQRLDEGRAEQSSPIVGRDCQFVTRCRADFQARKHKMVSQTTWT